jgi:hypothetical protein
VTFVNFVVKALDDAFSGPGFAGSKVDYHSHRQQSGAK